MIIITENNLKDYYGRVFTLKRLRDSFSNEAIVTDDLKKVATDILGRIGIDKGTFSNLKNMNKRLSYDDVLALRDKFNYYITNNHQNDSENNDQNNSTQFDFEKKYKLESEKCEMMNSTVKVLAENGVLNVFDGSLGSVFVKEPQVMQERVLEGDRWSWLIVIFASLYNTYVLGCIEEEIGKLMFLVNPLMDDKEHCTSGRLLAGLNMEETGLAGESDFWKRVEKLEDVYPSNMDVLTFNDEQKGKMAWHIYCMQKQGRLAHDIEVLTDNDIVRIILDMDKSSFLNGMDKQKLEYYRDLAEKYGKETATNANPQYIYGVTPMR